MRKRNLVLWGVTCECPKNEKYGVIIGEKGSKEDIWFQSRQS